jgi:ribosomal protein L24
MDLPQIKVGDKVVVKPNRANAGMRGEVTSIDGKTVRVSLEGGRRVGLKVDEFRNYSLAARKAWIKMPNRHVGRPKGSVQSDRVSVTLRFERTLWQHFLRLEQTGIIRDRVQLFNRILGQIIKKNGSEEMRASYQNRKESAS